MLQSIIWNNLLNQPVNFSSAKTFKNTLFRVDIGLFAKIILTILALIHYQSHTCISSISFFVLFMVALWHRTDHYIFILWFLLSFCLSFFFFFPRLISAVADWMSTILPHMVWPSVNLECRSEMWCARLAGNAGPKKSPSGHHRTTVGLYIFATNARIDNRKKLVKHQYLLHMSSQYGNLPS